MYHSLRSCPMLSWSLGLFLFSETVRSATVIDNNGSAVPGNDHVNGVIRTAPGIITIPLIPHSVQRQRHLDLARRLEKINRDAGYPPRRRLSNQERRLQEDNVEHFDAEQVAALYQGYGTHYADLWCGTPPQRQTVIVDTGSGVTAFPCSECRDCGVPNYHIDALYEEGKSSTFRSLPCAECLRGSCSSEKNTCTIGQAYQEGSSWNAFEAIDSCYVGGVHSYALEMPEGDSIDGLDPFNARSFSFPMKFGCQTKLTGLFKTQLADGIMGMDVAEPSYWWQMYDAQKIAHKSFSLCFSRKDQADPSGTEAGAMSLGGTDTRLHKTEMVYSVTDGSSSGFYVVHVKKVWLREAGGGESAVASKMNLKHLPLKLTEADINGNRVIVDSGTTDSYFSNRFGVAFKEVWRELTGFEYNHDPVDMTKEELMEKMPTILFQLNGSVELNKAVKDKSGKDVTVGLVNDLDPEFPYDVILAIPPSHYFEYDEEIGKYVSRFYVDDNNGGVLGANAMMGHDVYFDVERKRLGWAESDCDHTSLVSSFNEGHDVSSVSNPTTKVEDSSAKNQIDNNGDNNVDNKEEFADDDGEGVDDGTSKYGEGNEATQTDEWNGEYVDVEGAQQDSISDYPTGFCSGIGCQVIVTIVILFSVIFIAWRLVRKAPSGPNYDLTHDAELEMSAHAAESFDDEDFATGKGAIRYRDSSNNNKIV